MAKMRSNIGKIASFALVAASGIAGCAADSQPQSASAVTNSTQELTLPAPARRASGPQVVLRFSTMYGVDGPFMGDANPVRGLHGDDLPWQIADSDGQLLSDGTVTIAVRGLIFPNTPEVPPAQRGINDEDNFRAMVSCLTEGASDTPTANVATQPFPATRSGNSFIHGRVELPNPCIAPIVFIISGDEDDWLAVTGVETD